MTAGRNISTLVAAWRGQGRHGVVLEWLAEETAKAHRYAPDESVPEAMSALLELARAAAEPKAKPAPPTIAAGTRCQWTYDDYASAGQMYTETCSRPAGFTSCNNGFVCCEHKCRCSKPVEVRP